MEVKIGVQNVAREITFDTDATAEEVAKAVAQVVDKGGLLTLTDAMSARRPRRRPSVTSRWARASAAVGFGTL